MLLLGCAHRPSWNVRGADLRAAAGRELIRDCADGRVDRCYALAQRVEEEGSGGPEQGLALYQLYLQGCEAGHAGSCDRLGLRHAHGEGPNPDPQRTQGALVKACHAGQGVACHTAGGTLDEGRLGPVDEAAAYLLFVRGCEANHPACCAWAGLKLAFGRGAPQDRGKATRLFDKACGLGEHQVGCFNLALHVAELPEDQQDPARLLELMRMSCDAGNQVGCENVAVLEEALQGEGSLRGDAPVESFAPRGSLQGPGHHEHVAFRIGEVGSPVAPWALREGRQFPGPGGPQALDDALEVAHVKVDLGTGDGTLGYPDGKLAGVLCVGLPLIQAQPTPVGKLELLVHGCVHAQGPPEGGLVEAEGPMEIGHGQDGQEVMGRARDRRLRTDRWTVGASHEGTQRQKKECPEGAHGQALGGPSLRGNKRADEKSAGSARPDHESGRSLSKPCPSRAAR